MKFEKLFYVIISTLLITAFVLVSYISSPVILQSHNGMSAKRIYFVDNISPAHQAVIKSFNQRYKGQIEVVPINLPFEKFSTNERKELLARFLRSKSDRIDIFSVDQIWVPRFAKWGVSLEKYISPAQKSNLLKYAMESCYYDNELIAVPLYIDVALMFYRADMLKKLSNYNTVKQKIDNSITWEDFISLHKAFPDKARPFFTFQGNDFEGLMCIFQEMLASQNSSLMKGDSLKLNTPEARKALSMLVDLVHTYNVSPKEVSKFKENPSYDYFVENSGVFLRAWPPFLSDMKVKENLKPIAQYLEKAPTPHFQGGRTVSVYGGWNLVLSKYSTKIPEAVIFINFLISEEAQKILYEQGGCLPVNLKLYNDSLFLSKYPDLKFFKHVLDNGVHRPFSERYTNISDIVSYYLNLAIKKKMPVDEALKKAEEKVYSQSILLK